MSFEPRFDDEELFDAERFRVVGEDFAFVVERVDFAFAFAWAGFAFDELLAFDLDDADVEAVRFFAADFVVVEDLVDFPVDDFLDDADFDFNVPAFAVEDFLVAGISFSSPIFEF